MRPEHDFGGLVLEAIEVGDDRITARRQRRCDDWPAASLTDVRSMPVAAFRMAMLTPGMTALWVSVIAPCSEAVDCARADAAAPKIARPTSVTLRNRDRVRVIIHPP